MAASREPDSTALYRLYDGAGQLLYVGVTNDLQRRWHQHSLCQPWWHLVARRDLLWHPDRPLAEAAESRAIAAEHPLYNVDQVPNARATQGQYDDAEDRRRVKRLLRRDSKRHYFHVGKTVYVPSLAERYDVSTITVWSVISRSGNDHCFDASRRMRLTVVREPTF